MLGTVLFNYTKPASTPISFTIKNDSGLTQVALNSIASRFFLLEQDDNYFSIQLKQTLDLELLHTDVCLMSVTSSENRLTIEGNISYSTGFK